MKKLEAFIRPEAFEPIRAELASYAAVREGLAVALR